LQEWEQGRRQPTGPARALLRVADRHPRALWAECRSFCRVGTGFVPTQTLTPTASRNCNAARRAVNPPSAISASSTTMRFCSACPRIA
jgi:hypothetical protein